MLEFTGDPDVVDSHATTGANQKKERKILEKMAPERTHVCKWPVKKRNEPE